MKHRYLKKFYTIISYFLVLNLFFNTPLIALNSDMNVYANAYETNISLQEQDLDQIIFNLYNTAQQRGIEEKMPEDFLICHALLKDNIVPVAKTEKLLVLDATIKWLALELKKIKSTEIVSEDKNTQSNHENIIDPSRKPRLDAPGPNSPIEPVGPGCCCDNADILGLLGSIRARIGTVDESSCQETVLGILGNACIILGPDQTISSALHDLIVCCSSTFSLVNSFSNSITLLENIVTELEITASVLTDIANTLSILAIDVNNSLTIIIEIAADLEATLSTLNTISECCANLTETVVIDFNGTWTAIADIKDTITTLNCCNGTFTALADIKSTIISDFNQTWTILADIKSTITTLNCCNGTFTALADIKSTIVTDFNGTWTMINAGFNGTFTAINAGFNGTFTAIADVKSTIISDFNQTWTILASLTNTTSILMTNICTPTAIRQADVTVTTYTISRPGRYILAENITFNPTAPQRAIDITSSDVTLDFLCSTLSQGNSTANVDAVRIASGLSGVKIVNGTIQNFTRAGITVSSGCSRSTIDNLTTFSCAVRGIELLGTAAAKITESYIRNCDLIACCQGAAGDFVMTISQCTDLHISNCHLNQNGNTLHTLQGLRLDNVLKGDLNNIDVNDNLASTDFRGFALSQSVLCTLKNCTTKNNSATAAASAMRGFILESNSTSTANSFYDCIALNNTGTGTVDGFLTDTGCNDNLFTRCESSFNSSQGSAATAIVHGFNTINNSRTSYIDCLARNNSAPNSTATPAPTFGSIGFELNTCTAGAIFQSLSRDNTTGGGSTSVGYKVFQGSQCAIRESSSARHSVGFRLDPANSTSHVFSKNLAQKNTTQYSQFPIGSTQNAGTISNINASLNSPWTNASIG